LFFAFFICAILSVFSQNNFNFIGNTDKQTISFKLLSNLIVLPIEVNGKELNFILDSGVGQTVLFNLNPQDSILLKNEEAIKLKGLGKNDAIDAIVSKGNRFKLNNIISSDQKLYVVSNDNFDLSSKMGITIHGIIGYQLLKDFVVKINYSNRRITFIESENFEYSDCKKCESFNLEFYRLKPFVNVGVKLYENSNKITPVKLLIDSGGSDAMWLFENTHPDIISPTNFFNDFLGEGLSGSVYGKRTRINSIVLGSFELKKPTVSYPDSTSVAQALHFKKRNGSLGAVILKRFVVTFDYKKAKIYLKKGSGFKEPFRYNMSGIELVYNGKILVKEKGAILPNNQSNQVTNNTVTLEYSYKFLFKPTYKIQKVQPGSPAADAGILPGDILIKINGKYTYDLKLEEIVEKLYQKENTRINLVVERYGKDYEFTFKLKDLL